MIFIESTSTNPYFNLALEEYVFENMSQIESYFLLWQNYNTIVVGKNQNTVEEINQEFVKENKIRVVRRLSGGGAVYHDRGNLNYTFIVKKKQDFDFQAFAAPVIEVLKDYGIQAEFTGRNDLVIDGQKFSGNSQYIKHGRQLHHGCIMLDSNLVHVSDALKVKASKYESKGIKSVKSRVTTINEHLNKPISMEQFKEDLKNKVILENDQVSMYELTEGDLSAINRLCEEKYETWEWNYGYSPDYTLRREMKFEAGLLTAYMNVSKGKIQEIRLFGDFFGTGDVRELEEKLQGMLLDDTLEVKLAQFPIEYYIRGLSAAELVQLISG